MCDSGDSADESGPIGGCRSAGACSGAGGCAEPGKGPCSGGEQGGSCASASVSAAAASAQPPRRQCVRCSADDASYPHRQPHLRLCGPCFVPDLARLFSDDFRACYAPGDVFCLGVSGGTASLALLHMLQTALHGGTVTRGRRKGRHVRPKTFRVVPVYVACPQDDDGDASVAHLTRLRAAVATCGFAPLIETPMSAAAVRALAAAASATSRDELRRTLRLAALRDAMRQHGCTKLMLGECATRLAVSTLVDVASGRGFSLPDRAAVVHTDADGVTTVRPLANLEMHQLEPYLALTLVDLPPVSQRPAPRLPSSIAEVTARFLTRLHAEFPRTEQVVLATTRKLAAPASCRSDWCCMCGDAIRTGTAATPCDDGGVLCRACDVTLANHADPVSDVPKIRSVYQESQWNSHVHWALPLPELP